MCMLRYVKWHQLGTEVRNMLGDVDIQEYIFLCFSVRNIC